MWLKFEWEGSLPRRSRNCLQKLCYEINHEDIIFAFYICIKSKKSMIKVEKVCKICKYRKINIHEHEP